MPSTAAERRTRRLAAASDRRRRGRAVTLTVQRAARRADSDSDGANDSDSHGDRRRRGRAVTLIVQRAARRADSDSDGANDSDSHGADDAFDDSDSDDSDSDGADDKYKAHMAKLERGQTTINDVGRKFGLSKRTISSAGKQFKSAR